MLIIIPRWFVGDTINYRYMFPLGLAYIASKLKKSGHRVDILNINHYCGPVNLIINNLVNERNDYDYICTGGISTFYNQIKEVVEAVKKTTCKAKVIIGGGLVSSEPELIINKLMPDYAILGEGEEAILELIECLSNGGEIRKVDGVVFIGKAGELVFTRSRAPLENLDLLPYPDFEGFEFSKYLDHMHPSDLYAYDLFDYPRAYPIICSRSCPYQCTFCFHPIGKKYRQRSIESIMRELEENVPRYRINIISIYDELFSRDRERVIEFCGRIKDFLAKLDWECKWGCQMRVDAVDDEMLAIMREAGCYMVSYGFESYHPAVLQSMKKYIKPEQINRAVELTIKNSISIQANFIFGDSAETLETARTTLDYWRDHINAGITLSFINPYPGTEICQKLVRRGVIKDKIDFIANHIFDVFNMSEKMTDNDFGRLWFDVLGAKLRYRAYAERYQLSAMEDQTFKIKVECPHCHQEIEYQNYYILSKVFVFIMFYCRNCRKRFYLASKLYRLTSLLLFRAAKIMPGIAYSLFRRVWSFLKKHDPRFTRKGLGALFRNMSDSE